MAGFKMGFNKEKLKGPEPVPNGIYILRMLAFNPKLSEKKDSTNLNAVLEVTGNGDLDGKKVFLGLNTKIPNWIQDFVHALGMEMEDQLSEEPSIPGVFDGDPVKFKADDPSTWVYKGPLIGRTGKFELGQREYQGRMQQDAKQFICAVPGCATKFPDVRHTANMGSK